MTETTAPVKGPAGRRVLVVEDDEDVRAALEDVLSVIWRGAKIDVVRSAEAAYETASNGTFDVAVVGHRIRGTDGVSVAQALSKAHPGMETVLTTAYPFTGRAQEAKTAGQISRFIAKPFTAEDLIAAVDPALAAEAADQDVVDELIRSRKA